MKQELGVHKSVLGTLDTLPTNTAKIMEAVSEDRKTSDEQRGASSTPTRKYPPTRLYIEEEPGKKVETFVRWKQSQNERELKDQSDNVSDTRHLSELEKQIEMVQQKERSRQTSGVSDTDKTADTAAPLSAGSSVKKKDKKGSLSSILNVFSRKKTSAPTPPLKKKKSSLSAMMEKLPFKSKDCCSS